MSTDFFMYAQSTVDGKKIAVGPFVPTTKDSEHKGEFMLSPVLETCSWFRDAWDRMQESCTNLFDYETGLCDELREEFKFDDEDKSIWGEPKDYYNQCMKVYKLSDIQKLVKKDRPYKYQGYVYKSTIADYEVDEIDEIDYWYTLDEYKDLDEETKREVAYYEWNDYWDAYAGISRLVRNAEALLDTWSGAYGSGYDWNYRHQVMDNLEIVCYISF